MSITWKRRLLFARDMLGRGHGLIGFADVGSGGPLKYPWDSLPPELLRKFEFEPTGEHNADLPLCVSNHTGTAEFSVAFDERSSSFHQAEPEFVERFGRQDYFTKKKIEVQCTTLDGHFSGNYQSIDAMDINVEGHDYQVLQGAENLLKDGFVKLIKIEFELAPVWRGQGWFSDIDAFLRQRGFELADIEVEFARTANIAHLYSKGEPVWGKAYYVPSSRRWSENLMRLDADQAVKAVVLYCSMGLPGRAYEVLDMFSGQLDGDEVKKRIAWVYGWSRFEEGLNRLAKLGGPLFRCVAGGGK